MIYDNYMTLDNHIYDPANRKVSTRLIECGLCYKEVTEVHEAVVCHPNTRYEWEYRKCCERCVNEYGEQPIEM